MQLALRAVVAVAFALVLAAPTSAMPGARPTDVTVRVTHVDSDKGAVVCALFDEPRGFPSNLRRADRTERVRPRGGRAKCELRAVPVGHYAVAVFHDENDNGRLDRTRLRVRKEGLGLSNDPSPEPYASPSFGSARFFHPASAQMITVRVRY